jgi:hypothetical protein
MSFWGILLIELSNKKAPVIGAFCVLAGGVEENS